MIKPISSTSFCTFPKIHADAHTFGYLPPVMSQMARYLPDVIENISRCLCNLLRLSCVICFQTCIR